MKFITIMTGFPILIGVLTGCAAVKKANETHITMPNIGDKDNGIYRGEYKINPVQVIADVEVVNGNIKEIKIIKHICGLGKKAEKFIDQVVNNQTLDVDIVTGATVSSKAILKTIENALDKGITKFMNKKIMVISSSIHGTTKQYTQWLSEKLKSSIIKGPVIFFV
jgi:uncharacterized protein with FMN-binding domain